MYTEIPYKYYILDKLKWKRGVINEVESNNDKAWADTDYISFKNNIKKIPECSIKDTEFKMWKYTNFYSQMDVKIQISWINTKENESSWSAFKTFWSMNCEDWSTTFEGLLMCFSSILFLSVN